MTTAFKLSDKDWDSLKSHIPKTRGKSATSHRDFVEAICWVALNQGNWEKLPKKYGNWQTAKNRYRRWISCNYVDEIIDIYLKQLRDKQN